MDVLVPVVKIYNCGFISPKRTIKPVNETELINSYVYFKLGNTFKSLQL